MSARFFALARHDLRLQFRYGIYAAYAFVILFYVVVVVWARPYLPSWAPALVIYSDPAAVGFFFLGGLMMLEKSEGVRIALSVSPMSAAEYLGGKVLTLTGLALAACLVIGLLLGEANLPLLLAAVMLTSLTFLGIGFPLALRFRTVNGYMIGSAGLLTPIILPAGLAFLPNMPVWLAVYPPVSHLRLILVATGGAAATGAEIGTMIAVSAAGAAGGLWLGRRALQREMGER